MKIAVKDANVLIDLIEADLLGLWFQLGIETHTTDLVIHELKRAPHWQAVSLMIGAGNLRVRDFDATQLRAIQQAAGQLRVSLADASVLRLAAEIGAALLTGDRRVRMEAQARGLEVRGLLWVFDRLVEDGILDPADACTRLTRAREAGAFLPKDECEARLHRWRRA